MRLSILTITTALLLSNAAHAQYANRSLGIGAQATTSIKNNALFAVTLEASLYIESGFDVFLRVPLSITDTSTGAGTASGRGQIFATGGSLGIRYLFLEESIRPYVGIQFSGLVFLTQPKVDYYVGPGATVGLDFFVTDWLSIGARGTYDLFVMLNKSPRNNFGAGLNVATVF